MPVHPLPAPIDGVAHPETQETEAAQSTRLPRGHQKRGSGSPKATRPMVTKGFSRKRRWVRKGFNPQQAKAKPGSETHPGESPRAMQPTMWLTNPNGGHPVDEDVAYARQGPKPPHPTQRSE